MKIGELFENTRDPIQVRRDHVRWKQLVNMSATSLEKFLETPYGKEAGLSRQEAKKAGGIGTGRDSARAILRMKSTPFSKWSDNDIDWMYRQISFVSRMTGNSGPLFKMDKDGKKIPTTKLLSLWIWGNNPDGHPPSKYGVF